MKTTLPLGQDSDYPSHYDPALLFAIARRKNSVRGDAVTLPYRGIDIWNAWELTWLQPDGTPAVATAEICIPADSENLIESKSMKLYLNSFAMSHCDGATAVATTLASDLSRVAGAPVTVQVHRPGESDPTKIATLPGVCIDHLAARYAASGVDASLLRADANTPVQEAMHTHLLRSLCPVTAQPDIGSLAIHYRGPQIDPASLLQYVVSFRQHNDFHEACVERIFEDILARCDAENLSVYARYQRRGGIDINPFRSNFEATPTNLRLWRQ